MRPFKVRLKLRILPLQYLRLAAHHFNHMPLLDDLIRKGPSVQRQLLVRGEKFTAFLLQQPFRRQPRTAFDHQLFRQIHCMPRTLSPAPVRAWQPYPQQHERPVKRPLPPPAPLPRTHPHATMPERLGGRITMRAFALSATLFLATLGALQTAQAQQSPIPERRVLVTEGVDYPGADLQTIFDTSYDACEAACLGTEACVAFTFNTRSNACFPKSRVDSTAPYAGAFSARVVLADPGVKTLAAERQGDLLFFGPYDFDQARDLARRIGNLHVAGELPAADHLASAANARENGDFVNASKFVGAALGLTDASDLWVDYARLLLDSRAQVADDQRSELQYRAQHAAINAYLRAPSNPGTHSSPRDAGRGAGGEWPWPRHDPRPAPRPIPATTRRYRCDAYRCHRQIRLPHHRHLGAV